ncbi:hypothetical protein [Streptomyces sp. DH12]|uniref:hypothetical protein n=1 Tax=Streptomyces sp. DH12 TaxID=2857010 RepID=UPI001E28F7AE|nr:hypothetical protein [Streptomyces sp. DH12]
MTGMRYIGGPFDGGHNPDSFIDEIAISSPAGRGRYVRARGDDGVEVYVWEPDGEPQAEPRLG